ncbi:hypothetical protein T07_7009 [Trichinella nelsoni]|uniref:Uncharacterized protein n=1 Tax=Trichinella nelsoni TaxID=6336 RepID=A0A0V0RD58_9BILA|nr:hypothetical protein T07_7009 [Trichinella nelsoni]
MFNVTDQKGSVERYLPLALHIFCQNVIIADYPRRQA